MEIGIDCGLIHHPAKMFMCNVLPCFLNQFVSKVERSFYSNIQVILATPHHTFDCSQHANMEGEGLLYIYHVNCATKVDREKEGVLTKRTPFCTNILL